MAITTVNEKYSVLSFCNWLAPSFPIVSGGLSLADKKQLLHGYPTIPWPDPVDSGNSAWIARYRRRGKR